MFGYTMKITYNNLTISTFFPSHFWQLKTSKITFFFEFRTFISHFGDILPVKKGLPLTLHMPIVVTAVSTIVLLGLFSPSSLCPIFFHLDIYRHVLGAGGM